MKRLLLALLAVILAAGGAMAGPTIPDSAVLSDQRPVAQCESGLLLRYYYDLPDGSVWVTFKQPNQDPRIVMHWKPGNDDVADEMWVDGKLIPADEFRVMYPHPCVLFDAPKV